MERLTTHTLTTTRSSERALASIRTRAFAIDNEEFELGVVCVAAAIIGPDGGAVGAVSVSGPTERMRHADLEALGALGRQLVGEDDVQGLKNVGWSRKRRFGDLPDQ